MDHLMRFVVVSVVVVVVVVVVFSEKFTNHVVSFVRYLLLYTHVL